MNCPTCGSENPPEAEYCANCGVRYPTPGSARKPGSLWSIAPSCGAENAQWATSCASCGEPLQALPAERGGTTPASDSAGHPYYPPSGYAPTTGVFIPRNLDGLLGETFRVYRGNFWMLLFNCTDLPDSFPHRTGSPSTLGDIHTVPCSRLYDVVPCGRSDGPRRGSPVPGKEDYCRPVLRQGLEQGGVLAGQYHIFHPGLAVSAVLAAIIVGIPLFFYILVRWFFYTEAIMIEGRSGSYGRR